MPKASKSSLIYNYIRRGIETGKFSVNERIPTDRELVAQFGISRPIVSGAIHRLAEEHLIHRNRKAGSIVIAIPPRSSLTFGAILLGLASQHHEQTICDMIGRELSRQAAMDRAFILLQDPSWSEDPGEAGVFHRARMIAGDFITRKISGAFIMPQEILANQLISPTIGIVEDFQNAGIPVVLIDRDIVRHPMRSRMDWVGIDNFGAGYTLAKHFIDLGCRKIDFFAHTTQVPTQEARIDGYLRALELRRIHTQQAGVFRINLFDSGAVVETLRRRRPEAVLVVSDSRAIHIMQFAVEAGIKIPEDLRIGSFDDLPMSAHLSVPLTTIRQPAASVAAVALRTMFQRMDNPHWAPVHSELQCELVVRQSSGSPVATARSGITHPIINASTNV
ncbi:MAG: GntR family transcriptional regulator [Planctomycetes bacterium]|nr:GntR family transcriptional regulator [Planctomycetota bacterium]